jgi:hypothetical protein
MKTLNNTILKVEHFTTIRGEEMTGVKIRIKGHVEEKYMQIEVNELDVEQTPREKIVLLLLRLSSESLWCQSKKLRAHIDSKIQGLEIALTYLN